MAIERRTLETLTVSDVQAQIDCAKDGAVIELPPGRIRGRLVIDRPLSLRGAGAGVTIIDAASTGPAIAIDATGEVSIEELTLTGGCGAQGGAIAIDNGAKVRVLGCMIERNQARAGRGGAIGIDRGELSVLECTLVRNAALIGGAIFAGGDATVEIAATIIAENSAVKGGGIAALDAAAIEIWTCRLEKNQAELEGHHLYLAGTRFERPRLLLANAVLGPVPADGLPIANHRAAKASVTIDHSTIGRELHTARVLG